VEPASRLVSVLVVLVEVDVLRRGTTALGRVEAALCVAAWKTWACVHADLSRSWGATPTAPDEEDEENTEVEDEDVLADGNKDCLFVRKKIGTGRAIGVMHLTYYEAGCLRYSSSFRLPSL